MFSKELALETLRTKGKVVLDDEDVGNLSIVRLAYDTYSIAEWNDDPFYDEGYECVGTYAKAKDEIHRWFKTYEQIMML